MSEAHRSDSAHAPDATSGAERDVKDRDAKIEQLLLVGLDHYFGARYEQAINVWTRALFLDRNHARARAYIERARTALAEGQRESEELLQTGVAAFHRGEGDEARRLLQAAIDRGAPPEEALAVLERLNRLEAAVTPAAPYRTPRVASGRAGATAGGGARSWARMAAIFAPLVLIGVVYLAWSGLVDWRSLLFLRDAPVVTAAPPPVREGVLPLPRRGEKALARAQSLVSAGHLHDALAALDGVRPTDPERADADTLRTSIQRQLLSLANGLPPPIPDQKPGDRKPGDQPVP
jgi:tetratricopeptide (TPR) repeat protein